MQNVEKISMALPPDMAALMRQVVKAGEYASTSDVIRDALREWTDRRERRQRGLDELRARWDEAINDPRPHGPAAEVLTRLRGKYQVFVEAGGK